MLTITMFLALAAAVPGVVFQSPAGALPAGALSLSDPFAGVLPSGRFVRPTGTSVAVDPNAQGLALTPAGRYAIVTSGGVPSGAVSIVDTTTLAIVSHYSEAAETYFAGVVAVVDPLDRANTLVFASGGTTNAVYAFDVDGAGAIRRDPGHLIAIPAPSDTRYARQALASTLVANAAGTRVFVVDTLGNDVAQIDTSTRALAGTPVPVGYFPFGAALSSAGLLVANQGLLAYQPAAAPAPAPPFATVPADLARASSLSLLPQNADGSFASAVSSYAPLDRTPDGIREVGGAQPAAIAAMRRRPYAFVAMSSVDRIATISLTTGAPVARGGTELRLYDRGPYGTQPVALVLAPSERRLYVALAGIDAIAVLDTTDPAHLHRVGLIPTGWYPSALALSADGRFLFVVNAKGLAASTLERIDLSRVDLRRSTPLALANLRSIAPAKKSLVVPQRFGSLGSAAIKHVVFVMTESATYDAMLGDLTDGAGVAYGPGDPRYVAFNAALTPNVHALARTYGLAGNMFADADAPGVASQFAAGGVASNFTQKFTTVLPPEQDPEDYPRAGYIFNALAVRGRTYRDYGELLRLRGYEEVPPSATGAPLGLGGQYTSTAPAPLALSGHVDLNYAGWNQRIRNTLRAAEFQRDFDLYVKAGTVPAFTYVSLPPAHVATDARALSDDIADADRAIGSIVEYLTHTPQWGSTAIFVVPSDALESRDHVAPSRTFALVISPYAKRHYVGTRHLSTVSVLKTEEELLGLPALSLGDALASDMADFFSPVADLTPFERADAP